MQTTIGVDLHKDSLTTMVLDDHGTVIERKDLATKCHRQIRDYFASYGPHCQVAVESVGFYYWFWELVRPTVQRLVLADPAGVRAHAGRKAKTDRNDALLLATLLRENRLPMAYVPTDNIRALRELVRHRHSVSRSLARERRSLRWLALKNNLPGPSTFTSDRAQKWILSQEAKFSPPHRLAAHQRLDQIIALERHLADADRAITQHLVNEPILRQQAELIATVPGIGPLTAVTLLAETGDITRFDNPDQLGAYAGLAPRVSQSGQTVHHGHISKHGPPILRWVLQQAAWVAIRTDPQARRLFTRVSKHAGTKKAATALARKLLIYAWSVARRQTPFHWPNDPVPTRTITGPWSYDI
jgi:transposase